MDHVSLFGPRTRKKTSLCDVRGIKCVSGAGWMGGVWIMDWKLQQLEQFSLSCYSISPLKKKNTYRRLSRKKKTVGDTDNQKQQISSLKHSKEEETKEWRDNRGHWSIRVNTLSQIRLQLACCYSEPCLCC